MSRHIDSRHIVLGQVMQCQIDLYVLAISQNCMPWLVITRKQI